MRFPNLYFNSGKVSNQTKGTVQKVNWTSYRQCLNQANRAESRKLTTWESHLLLNLGILKEMDSQYKYLNKMKCKVRQSRHDIILYVVFAQFSSAKLANAVLINEMQELLAFQRSLQEKKTE